MRALFSSALFMLFVANLALIAFAASTPPRRQSVRVPIGRCAAAAWEGGPGFPLDHTVTIEDWSLHESCTESWCLVSIVHVDRGMRERFASFDAKRGSHIALSIHGEPLGIVLDAPARQVGVPPETRWLRAAVTTFLLFCWLAGRWTDAAWQIRSLRSSRPCRVFDDGLLEFLDGATPSVGRSICGPVRPGVHFGRVVVAARDGYRVPALAQCVVTIERDRELVAVTREASWSAAALGVLALAWLVAITVSW